MKLRGIAGIASAVVIVLFLSPAAFAATSPSLGTAASFGILSNTYTNSVAGTTVNGDLGYSTGPSVAPTVTGNTNAANAAYTQAGTDQASALAALNSQACTFTFATGAIDFATDTTHGTVGVYSPGVYCVTGAASIGTAGITLNGNGVYVFRMSGALTTTAASSVTLTNGASSADLWWTPIGATTLAANSIFAGTDIDNAGITIRNLVTWSGNALAYGGTVSTSLDTINGSTFTVLPNAGSGTSVSTSNATSSNTSKNGDGGSTDPSNQLSAPDTGFGAPIKNQYYNFADYFIASSALVLLAGLFLLCLRHCQPTY